MGIWGPGAITVTYFYFTMKNSFAKLFNFLNITLPNVSEGYVLLIFYRKLTGSEHLKNFLQKNRKMSNDFGCNNWVALGSEFLTMERQVL